MVAGEVAGEILSGLGLYLWMSGIFTAYMFIASLRTTRIVAILNSTFGPEQAPGTGGRPACPTFAPEPARRQLCAYTHNCIRARACIRR